MTDQYDVKITLSPELAWVHPTMPSKRLREADFNYKFGHTVVRRVAGASALDELVEGAVRESGDTAWIPIAAYTKIEADRVARAIGKGVGHEVSRLAKIGYGMACAVRRNEIREIDHVPVSQLGSGSNVAMRVETPVDDGDSWAKYEQMLNQNE